MKLGIIVHRTTESDFYYDVKISSERVSEQFLSFRITLSLIPSLTNTDKYKEQPI